MKIPVVKLTVKGGSVRRRAGRPKYIRETQPRLPKGKAAEIKALQREQARARRMAALNRRHVRDALGDAALPAGASVSNLTPLQAQEIALEQQGLTRQAEQLAATEAARQEAAAAAAERRQEAADAEAAAAARHQAQIDASNKHLAVSKAERKAAEARAAELKAMSAAAVDELKGLRRDANRASAVQMATRVTGKSFASAATPSPPPRGGAAAASPASRAVSPTPVRRSTRARGQKADGLDPFRTAMALAEEGDLEGARRLVRSLKRAKADPASKCMAYIDSLE